MANAFALRLARRCGAAALLVLGARTAGAQMSAPSPRQGFWFSGGLGYGSAGVSCSGCETTRQSGPALRIALGGWLNPSWKLGGEISGWSHEESGVTDTFAFITGVAQWYPQADNGFFLKAGAGVGGVTAEGKAGTTSVKVESNGLAYQVGVGYDLRIGTSWSLTPYADFLGTTQADAKVNGSSANEKLNGNLFHAGLALSFH